jgi:hypothetical protein
MDWSRSDIPFLFFALTNGSSNLTMLDQRSLACSELFRVSGFFPQN